MYIKLANEVLDTYIINMVAFSQILENVLNTRDTWKS